MTTEKLRYFAQAILSNLDGIDQSDIEDAGIKYGLLEIHIPVNPCGEFCKCAEFYDMREFTDGEVRCHRVAKWVKTATSRIAV